MELALAIRTLEHEELSFVAQLGVKGVILGGTGITEQIAVGLSLAAERQEPPRTLWTQNRRHREYP